MSRSNFFGSKYHCGLWLQKAISALETHETKWEKLEGRRRHTDREASCWCFGIEELASSRLELAKLGEDDGDVVINDRIVDRLPMNNQQNPGDDALARASSNIHEPRPEPAAHGFTGG